MLLAEQLELLRTDTIPPRFDLVAFSLFPWNFLRGRSHHLLQRFAESRRVFFVQEPVLVGRKNFNELYQQQGVTIVVPHLKEGTRNIAIQMRRQLHDLFMKEAILDYLLWYSSPTAFAATSHLSPALTIYDCSHSAGNSWDNSNQEMELLSRAQVVFTDSFSLLKHKQPYHTNIHLLAPGVDASHFAYARNAAGDPTDQAEIPHPRIGYAGRIDPRMDFQLLSSLAKSRPHWQFVLLGPLSALNPRALPQQGNIHYLGRKRYAELPEYMAGWDVAMAPFAINAATRYLNPGKIAEFLAAGKPVVATPIPDISINYGPLVHIADGHAAFANAIHRALSANNRAEWLAKVDARIENMTWEDKVSEANRHITEAFQTARLRAPVTTLSFLEAFGRKVTTL